MLDERQRSAILELAAKGFGSRRIARALDVSRSAVRSVIESGQTQIPKSTRHEKGEPYRDQILELYPRCKGNLVRVHEELTKDGAELSYQALTAFCRRQAIGRPPKLPAGRYDFTVAEEMQHDTSPHRIKIAGKMRETDTASLVLCYSRMTFFQFFPRTFDRFACKVFLTEALQYFGGSCGRCMVDNTNVVRHKGTGKAMVPAPEMVRFGERFGFVFVAHEVGDANRSARVEGPFNVIDNNFLAGREFSSWEDANAQARSWCDVFNAKHSPKLHASRRELFASERCALRALPDFIPEVYVLHQRIVDAEGYVSVRRNRYSVPYQLIGRQMEVRESKSRIDVFDGPRQVATHQRVMDAHDRWITVPAHRPPRGQGRAQKRGPSPAETELLIAEPSLHTYVTAIKQHVHGRGVRALQRLRRMLMEYPRSAMLGAVEEAYKFGLYDLDRLERMVLRRIARDFFVVPELDTTLSITDDKDNEDE
jgi:hypothetical protein